MSERTKCLIDGCRRTTAIRCGEFLCQRHWSMVPKRVRRIYGVAKRRRRRALGDNWRILNYLCERLWDRAKRELFAVMTGTAP